MRSILMFYCEGQTHKTVSPNHNLCRREGAAEAESNRGTKVNFNKTPRPFSVTDRVDGPLSARDILTEWTALCPLVSLTEWTVLGLLVKH